MAPHVVVPARNLREGGAQHDASLGIEGEGDGVGLEAGENQCLVSKLRKPSMSPIELHVISAQIFTR